MDATSKLLTIEDVIRKERKRLEDAKASQSRFHVYRREILSILNAGCCWARVIDWLSANARDKDGRLLGITTRRSFTSLTTYVRKNICALDAEFGTTPEQKAARDGVVDLAPRKHKSRKLKESMSRTLSQGDIGQSARVRTSRKETAPLPKAPNTVELDPSAAFAKPLTEAPRNWMKEAEEKARLAKESQSDGARP